MTRTNCKDRSTKDRSTCATLPNPTMNGSFLLQGAYNVET